MLTAGIEQIRAMEQRSIASGVPEYELMRRAGIGAANWIAARYSDASRMVILCGGGNNGGDALVAAAELSRKFPVEIFSTKALNSFTGCAANAASDLPGEIPFYHRNNLDAALFRPGDVIIDGLLGIGFAGGTLRPEVKSFIHAANRSGCPVVALDLPSGINGDTGSASPDGAIHAAVTLTFGRPKMGLFAGDGSELRGALRVIEIGLTGVDYDGMEIMTNVDAVAMLPHWILSCHKNSRGRVLLWVGSEEYPGAAELAVNGAMRGGAGMVRVASVAQLRLPSAAIVRRLSGGETPKAWFPMSGVLVCGCGWGSCGTAENLSAAWRFPGTVLLDADALNTLACHPEILQPRENLILTPHPGEAARLAQTFNVDIALNRKDFALALAEKAGAVVVLKGRDSVVAAPDGRCRIIAAGSPALAVAGSGDVLAGVIGAVASQLSDPFDAASLGAYLHGIAGENAPGILIADELPEQVGRVIRAVAANKIF